MPYNMPTTITLEPQNISERIAAILITVIVPHPPSVMPWLSTVIIRTIMQA
jgi:hypothetical protein